MAVWFRCRPLSVSMGNAIKTLKLYISKTDPAGEQQGLGFRVQGLRVSSVRVRVHVHVQYCTSGSKQASVPASPGMYSA